MTSVSPVTRHISARVVVSLVSSLCCFFLFICNICICRIVAVDVRIVHTPILPRSGEKASPDSGEEREQCDDASPRASLVYELHTSFFLLTSSRSRRLCESFSNCEGPSNSNLLPDRRKKKLSMWTICVYTHFQQFPVLKETATQRPTKDHTEHVPHQCLHIRHGFLVSYVILMSFDIRRTRPFAPETHSTQPCTPGPRRNGVWCAVTKNKAFTAFHRRMQHAREKRCPCTSSLVQIKNCSSISVYTQNNFRYPAIPASRESLLLVPVHIDDNTVCHPLIGVCS